MLRSSFSTQLSAWVAGFIVVITIVVLILTSNFTKEIIKQESIDTTQQVMRNMGLRITYMLKEEAMKARFDGRPFRLDREKVEQMIKEKRFQETMHQSLPFCKYVEEETLLPELMVTDHVWKGSGGYEKVKIHEGLCYMFYEPVYHHQYGISTVFAEDLLYKPYRKLHYYMLVSAVSGVLLILFICWWVIARQILPLKRLAMTASRITDGKKEVIPECARVDEIGTLQNSLSLMQRSLDDYLAQMKEKNELLKERNAKLKAAYNEAAEYEDMKQRFLSKMTEQIAAPLMKVEQQTNYLTEHMMTMTEEEKAAMRDELGAAMYAITNVLDDLLNDPSGNMNNSMDLQTTPIA